MKTYHVLNLGAGVQSTTLALMFNDGAIKNREGEVIKLDAAVFADTGDEPEDPGHSVYAHLEVLKGMLSYPVLTAQAKFSGVPRKLSETFIDGVTGAQRFAAIPAFVQDAVGKKGQGRRQCTREFKVSPIIPCILQQVLGLKPKQRVPPGITVVQYIGFSLDEVGRFWKMRDRLENKPPPKWQKFDWPLLRMDMTRGDCRKYLEPRFTYRVPRSACVFVLITQMKSGRT